MKWSRRQVLRWAPMPLLLSSLSCVDDIIELTPEVTGPAITSVQLAATEMAVTKGSSQTVMLSIGRGTGFRGDVTLAVEDVPAGVTTTFGPKTLGPLEPYSLLTVKALTDGIDGTFDLKVVARANESESKSTTLRVSVTTPTVAFDVPDQPFAVAQGDTVTTIVNVVRGGGYKGSVVLSVPSRPPGTTVAFSPAVLLEGVNSAAMTMTADLLAEPAIGMLTVRATGTGIDPIVHTRELTIVPGIPRVAVVGNPVPFLDRVTTTSVPVNIGRSGNFAGPVTLTLENLPSGVTGHFSPEIVTGNATTLYLSANSEVQAGPHLLRIRAQGTGIPDATRGMTTVVKGFTLRVPAVNTFYFQEQQFPWSTSVQFFRHEFDGPISISLENPPPGARVDIHLPSGITGGQPPQFGVTMDLSDNIPLGLHSFAVRGKSPGHPDVVIPMTVTVSPPHPPSVHLSLTPLSKTPTIVRGTVGTYQLGIGRHRYSGAVTLTFSDLPPGISISMPSQFPPTAEMHQSTPVNIAIQSSAPLGVHKITFRASAPGIEAVEAVMTLTVWD